MKLPWLRADPGNILQCSAFRCKLRHSTGVTSEAKQRQTNLRITDASTLVNSNNWAWQSVEAVGRRRQWQGKQRAPNHPTHLSWPAGQRRRAAGRANTPLHFDLQAAAPCRVDIAGDRC